MGELLELLKKTSEEEQKKKEVEYIKKLQAEGKVVALDLPAPKKYSGYGYHGGGRPKKAESEKTKYVTISIAGSPEEVEQIRRKASESGKTLSRYIIDTIIGESATK